MLIYKNDLHSYRELPIRIAEFGQVHRHEFFWGFKWDDAGKNFLSG